MRSLPEKVYAVFHHVSILTHCFAQAVFISSLLCLENLLVQSKITLSQNVTCLETILNADYTFSLLRDECLSCKLIVLKFPVALVCQTQLGKEQRKFKSHAGLFLPSEVANVPVSTKIWCFLKPDYASKKKRVSGI